MLLAHLASEKDFMYFVTSKFTSKPEQHLVLMIELALPLFESCFHYLSLTHLAVVASKVLARSLFTSHSLRPVMQMGRHCGYAL